MKKFLFLVFTFFCSINLIEAAKYKCEYDFGLGEDAHGNFIMEYDTTKGTAELLTKESDYVIWILLQWHYYDYNLYFTAGEIKNYTENECPVLYLAYTYKANIWTTEIHHGYDFYSDSYLRESGGYDCINNVDPSACIKEIFDVYNEGINMVSFHTGTLKENSEINENKKLFSKCNSLATKIGELENLYLEYKNCGDNCIENKAKINKNIEEIKQYCNNIFQSNDVIIKTEEGYIEDKCLYGCINYPEQVEKMEKKYGHNVNTEGECNVSHKLIVFMRNILRWIKYIIPIAVIILGILDFIKAIGADKEDEIKKAQGKFIKRLIAAALIFLIPLIIEFVFGKMGFDYNACGLFK